jgi:predicted 3-demethylubiquinone-9 3-methyltransferase (glyoxalase superfamily)
MHKLSPFLWFDGNMEQAVNFYVSVFKDARIVSMNPVSATFELLGQLLGDPDRAKAQRVMQAMLQMKKIVVADLQAAYAA